MNRKKALLAVLLLLFAIVAVSSYFRMPRQKTVASLTYTPGKPATSKKAAPDQHGITSGDNRLRLDLLAQESVRFAGYKRNLFKPVFHEELKIIPLPPPPPPAKPVLPVAKPMSQPPPLLAEPTPVQRDMANFTFLGFLKKGNSKTIFLSSNKEIFLAHKGDRLMGKYEVTSITDEALVITSLSGGEMVIPLVENKPLRAPAQTRPPFPGIPGRH